MKASLAVGILIFTIGCGACLSQDQDHGFDPLGNQENQYPTRNVRLSVELVEVPTEAMADLLATQRVSGEGDESMRTKALGLVKGGSGKLVDTMVVVTKSGLPARVTSIQDYCYPTEYDAPVVGETKPPAAGDNKISPTPAPKPKPPLPTGGESRVPCFPTAFDKRELGTTLDVDPVVGARGTIVDVNVLVESVFHVGDEVFGKWKDASADVVVRMPKFHVMQVKTATTVATGKVQMIGAASPKDDNGMPDPKRKVLIFLTADVINVKE